VRYDKNVVGAWVWLCQSVQRAVGSLRGRG